MSDELDQPYWENKHGGNLLVYRLKSKTIGWVTPAVGGWVAQLHPQQPGQFPPRLDPFPNEQEAKAALEAAVGDVTP